jgi:hypothetical protein
VSRQGTPGFLQFSDNLKRIRAREVELAQESAVRREEFKASLVEEPRRAQSNLSTVIAAHRVR